MMWTRALKNELQFSQVILFGFISSFCQYFESGPQGPRFGLLIFSLQSKTMPQHECILFCTYSIEKYLNYQNKTVTCV